MRCPECHGLNEAGAAVCAGCGLILLNAAPAPKRRAEDYAGQKRRAADHEVDTCRFCGGQIEKSAIRCLHCSEIVNDDYYRDRARRIRSRVNYSSWVAYLFGLGALLVFRPVGIVSIAAGLLLSIVYYAIPVEPPASKQQRRRGGFRRFLKSQFYLERVSLPIPALRTKRLVFVGTPLIAALIGYTANVVLLQRPVNDVIASNNAFHGMRVSAHYNYYVVPGVVVYDLKELSFRQTPIDVHTAFLEFAKKMRDKRYSRVELAYRGSTKFSISGDDFARLGEEYAKRNFEYVLYEFPKLFRKPGINDQDVNANRDALLQFHRRWYGDDTLTETVVNSM
ncbi:MAG TPA: hypothetical protein VM779_04160 [Thermoanaerobaculia bacterium]|nr:hypothetical protein [Thermoanaerobaculia bacterium]